MKLTMDTSILEGSNDIRSLDELAILKLFSNKDFVSLYHLLRDFPNKEARLEFQETFRDLNKRGHIVYMTDTLDPVKEIGEVRSLPNEFELSKKAERAINPPSERVEDWIDDWRSLWPKDIKSGGYPVRGDRKGCLKKMRKILKENKDITKEEIFNATKKYLEERRNHNYAFTKVSQYFIDKNGESPLLAWIESLEDEERGEREYFKTDI